MCSEVLTSSADGTKVLLLGNEAIARGAIEAGVKVATAYPGTPSTEIVESLSRVGKQLDMHVEWSVNEHVALEVAMGAAQCGVRALFATKHNGLSAAYDMFTHLGIRDVTGGFVIVTADDPNMYSSQTEHDTRWMARCAGIPVIEPSDPQEAKDFTKYAVEISEKVKLPIMIRSVTRLSHMFSGVTLSRIRSGNLPAHFDFASLSLSRLMESGELPSPFWNSVVYRKLHAKEKQVESCFERFQGNSILSTGKEKFGIVASGFAYNYVAEALRKLALREKIAVFKVATPYPLPRRKLASFLRSLEELLVVEELEPFIELEVKALAKDVNPNLKIYTKEAGCIPREGELSVEIVANALARIRGLKLPYENLPQPSIFRRMLVMCAGCPHRAVGYALNQAIAKAAGNREGAIVEGDIGCYILLAMPPFLLNDMSFCMGAGLSVAQGRYHSGINKIHVALVGDSTFLHAGIPGLINAVYNSAPIKLIILDNLATAMTGFQPHAGTGKTATGDPARVVNIEEIVRACGVNFVRVVDPYEYRKTLSTLVEMLKQEQVAVVISRRKCAILATRNARSEKKRAERYHLDEKDCVGCQICTKKFGCPAIGWNEEDKKPQINQSACTECGVCSQICPLGAIKK